MPISQKGQIKTLVYLVYGSNQTYQDELSYSVLSALREAGQEASELCILLFCDEMNQRPDLPLDHYVISPEELNAWTLGGTYNHAIKISVLQKAMQITQGKLCFVDTDTAFTASPLDIFEKISDHSVVMHDNEGKLGMLFTWTSLLRKAHAAGFGDTVHPAAVMYNSGVIGVTPAMSKTVQDACTIMSDLYALEPVFNIEQFAVGAALSQHYEVQTVPNIVDHYWAYRRYVYHGKIPDAVAALEGDHSIKSAGRLPVIQDLPKPLIARLRARLHGMIHAADADYRFGYLAYLSSGSAPAMQDRPIWADIALDMAKRSANQSLIQRSFKRFAPHALASSGLDPARQDQWKAFWADAAD